MTAAQKFNGWIFQSILKADFEQGRICKQAVYLVTIFIIVNLIQSCYLLMNEIRNDKRIFAWRRLNIFLMKTIR